jgi:ketosteroid isomerase-like protein
MSEANIENALRAIEAWNRQDLAGFIDTWHPEAEWRPAFPKGTEGTGNVFLGHEGIEEAWRNVREAWDEYRVDADDARIVGENLLVLGRIHAKGRSSGIGIDSDWSAVVRFKDGKVISADWLDHSSALKATVVTQVTDAINRGDFDVLDEFATPDFEWVAGLGGAVEGGSYRGREGLETFFRELLDTWQEAPRVVPSEFRDFGDHVLVLGRIEARGRGSGVPVDAPYGLIIDFRGGKLSRMRAFLDHGEALRAAGLDERIGRADG